MPRVALIIVTYHSEKFLTALLFSLKAMREPDDGVAYIFVDNASYDGTVDHILRAFPQGIVIANKENHGFSVAVNQGINHPVARDAEYIALLNPDTAVDPAWLTELVDALDRDVAPSSAQSLLLQGEDRTVINSLGNKIHFLGFGFTHGNGEPYREQEIRNREQEITYSSGAAVLYRKKCLEDISLFDEDLFMYHDDLDVGWKFLLRGYRNVLVPSSLVYHHYEFSRSIRKYYWMERNRLMIIFTHYDYRTLLVLLPALLVLEFGLIFFSLLRGFFISRMKAYYWLVTHMPTLIKKHKTIQEMRNIEDREILKIFSGTISHQEIANPIVEYMMNPLFSLYLGLVRKVIRW